MSVSGSTIVESGCGIVDSRCGTRDSGFVMRDSGSAISDEGFKLGFHSNGDAHDEGPGASASIADSGAVRGAGLGAAARQT